MKQDKAALFLHYWKLLFPLDPVPVAEYRFHPVRKWRFDFAFVDQRVAVEVEGNAWNVAGGGRHMQDSDLEKYNEAAAMGWFVFRFSPGMLKSEPAGCLELVRGKLTKLAELK